MKNLSNPFAKKEYLLGFANGLNPHFNIKDNKTEAFLDGFSQGRIDYERMNGKIIHGIPKLIVTNKVLEDFLLAGMLGISINHDDYTAFQIEVIAKWYQSGIEKYNPIQSSYLLGILEQNGIDIF